MDQICDRFDLIRRMTIGGETRGRGRDKWGGGEKVEYGIEEVWLDTLGKERRSSVSYVSLGWISRMTGFLCK